MASSKEYLEFILGQLSDLEEITYRAMMGEFIIYYRGKIVGGIYDDRLLVKPVKAAISYIPTAPYELPYEGAKQMLLVDEVDNKNFLAGLFNAVSDGSDDSSDDSSEDDSSGGDDSSGDGSSSDDSSGDNSSDDGSYDDSSGDGSDYADEDSGDGYDTGY